MLPMAIACLVLALVAGYFGFRGGMSKSWEGAKLVFVIFLVLALVMYFASAPGP